MVFMSGDARPLGHLEGFGAAAQGLIGVPRSGPRALRTVEFLWGKPDVRDGREGWQRRCSAVAGSVLHLVQLEAAHQREDLDTPGADGQ
jgi:hypothetical protein